ncbi:MAG: MauE/DoxX family redox-associated membrane protein, partial [Pseudomonas sp.]
MHIDPIFIIASALAIAVLLASAATHKLRAPA